MSKKYKITEEAVRKVIKTHQNYRHPSFEEMQNWYDANFLEKICLTFKGKNPMLKPGPNTEFNLNQMAADYKKERLGIPSRKAPDKDWVAYWKRYNSDDGQRLETEFWKMEMALEDKILGYRIPRTL